MPRLASREELREQVKSLVDTELDDLETQDRSQLQNWSECPWRAAAIESGRVKIVGLAAEAGEAIHHALSTVTRTWVLDGNNYDTSWAARDSLRTDLEFELRRSRPDLQPEVLKGMMPSVWAWARFLSEIRPGNVLGFDGGEDVQRTGQLAYDMPDLGARVTSELDLIYANPQTTDLVEWIDYKTGHATHDVYDVADAFQFQLHALLLLTRFMEVKAARCRVWDTRTNRQTYAVTFPRERLHSYEHRVRSAVETRKRYQADPPCWPFIEKCSVCPAAAICPSITYPENAEPHVLLRDLVATEAKAEALRKRLAAHVDAAGNDIQSPDGVCFGRNRPKAERKAPAVLYQPKGSSNGSDTGS